MAKMVPIEDAGHMVTIYGHFVEVFSNAKVETSVN
jgi:hypothetical protein